MQRYVDLLRSVDEGDVLNESPSAVLPDELHLQSLWFAGQFGREFETVDGGKVSIVQFGEWNHGAGPDFLHAAIELEGERISGSLELDHRATNWDEHGHAQNESFNSVILHVVFEDDRKDYFTRTLEHKSVPRVVISQNQLSEVLSMPLLASVAVHQGRCFQPLADMSLQDVDALMMGSVKHRAALKSLRRNKTIAALGEDAWLWQAFAETLGYRPNRLAMTLLGQRLPIEKLSKIPSSAEAIIFGTAGFLSPEIHKQAPEDSRQYLRVLWEKWWQVRGEYELAPEREISWKLVGSRPINHPQRRLGCLAQVAKSWSGFKKACQNVRGVEEWLMNLEDDFWNYHYTLKSKRSARRLALIGEQRIRDFQINHLAPLHLQQGEKATWEWYMSLPAPALSEKVERASMRLFGNTESGVKRRKNYLRKAWQHQALLQIYDDFCLQDTSDCHECLFPEQLAQWRAV